MLYQTRQGVFGPAANGGGIFNNAVSGLGALGQDSAASAAAQMEAAMNSLLPGAATEQGITLPSSSTPTLQKAAPKISVYAPAPAPAPTAASKPKTGAPVFASAATAAPAAPAPYTAQATSYPGAGGGISGRTIAFMVGGVAAAGFVYLYVTKKKRKTS